MSAMTCGFPVQTIRCRADEFSQRSTRDDKRFFLRLIGSQSKQLRLYTNSVLYLHRFHQPQQHL